MECNITLNDSYKVIFSLSTTPFYWDMIGAENSWSIPLEDQNSKNLEFSNYFLWSLLILIIPLFFSLWSCWYSSLNTSKVLYFSLIYLTQVYLKKSFTGTKTFLFLLMLSTCIGLIRSIWINSRTLEVVRCWSFLWGILVCLHIWHSQQIFSSSTLIFGNILIASSDVIIFILLRLRWPSFWC